MDNLTVHLAPSVDASILPYGDQTEIDVKTYDESTTPDPHDLVVFSDNNDEILSQAHDWLADHVGVVILNAGSKLNDFLLQEVGVALHDLPDGVFVHQERETHTRLIQSATIGNGQGAESDQSASQRFGVVPTSRSPFDSDEPSSLRPLFVEAVSHLITHKQQGFVSAPETDEFPEGLEYYTFTVTKQDIRSLPYDNEDIQSVTISFDYHFALFLNDPPHGEHYQYIHLREEVRASPGELAWTYNDTWSYGAMQFHLELENSLDHPDIVLEETAPENEVEKTEVTDTTSFDIGFSTTDGGSGQFGYSKSRTHIIKDWEIINESTGNDSSWTYAQNTPYDGKYKKNSSFCKVCNAGEFGGGVDIGSIPALSRGTLTLDTQSVWRTQNVITDPVTLHTDYKWWFSAVTKTGFGCMPHWWWVSNFFGVDIDMSKVPEKNTTKQE
ncbi:hypothetical protein [Halomontanus rarus]|uniref:hypothetical protein n=1 Tax=Halomontanus rarus TaxID=3034020 RepID=UPI0023E8AD20|nr:hypothetical protein [Halovivax sp. TS33]